MALIAYPVRYYQDEEGGWNAEFPGLEGCLTCGETVAEVKANAVEALTGYLLSFYDHGHLSQLPPPSGEGETVTPELPDNIARALLAATSRK